MGFNTGASRNVFNQRNDNAGNNANGGNGDPAWKAQGFLNFYLPNKDGKQSKLGAIPLKASRPNERRMLEWLMEDANRAQIILSKLIIEFRSSEPTEGSAFDLDTPAPEKKKEEQPPF